MVNQQNYIFQFQLLVKIAGSARPEAPDGIAQYMVDGLDRQDVELLRQIGAHAEELVTWKEAQAAGGMEEEEVIHEGSEKDGDHPDDVPTGRSPT